MKQDLAQALAKLLANTANPLGASPRKSLDGLSDPELNRVAEIIADPAYIKYKAATWTATMQKKTFEDMAFVDRQGLAVVNDVLVRHGLKPIP
ncbi:MAG: hypothetical protein ABI612_13160 [Betaproteobacteria bacterium]